MAIEIQSMALQHGKVNEFYFKEGITKYIIGIRSYSVHFNNYNYHNFRNLGLNIEVAGVINNKLTVTPWLTLDDCSGNGINSESYVEVCVIAWTGNGHEYVQAISNQKFPYSLNCSDRVVNSGCILSGFNVSVPCGDLKPNYFHVGTSMDFAQEQFIGSGNVNLCSAKGNRAVSEWVKGSMFADCDKSSNLYVQSFSNFGEGINTISVNAYLISYCIVLTSITIDTERDCAEQGIKCRPDTVEWQNGKMKLNCQLAFPGNPASSKSKISGLLIGIKK